jgi:hypothetical protein
VRRQVLATFACLFWAGYMRQNRDAVSTVKVDVTAGHAINSFDPDVALGSTIDAVAFRNRQGLYAPLAGIELGEEPDGKHALPEDSGALYLQWAAAIHKVDSKLKLGGPVFEGVNEDITVWPDAQGRRSWIDAS